MSVRSSHAATTGQAITWVGWQRICSLAGVIFSFLGVAASALPTVPPPALSDSATQIARTCRDHHTAFLISDVLLAISAFFFLWFLGGLRSALRQQEEERSTLSSIAFGSGLVVAGVLVLEASLEAGLVFRATTPAGGHSGTAFILFASDTLNILLAFSWIFGASLVSAVSMANLWAGFQPRWLVFAGLALAVVLLANPLVVFSRGDGVWLALSAVATGGFLLWTMATSIYLFVRANLRAPRW